MDIIFITDLRLDILIGVYDWERKVPQTVQLDLEIGIPDAQPSAQRPDRARRSTTPRSSSASRQSLEQDRFLLVERLAEHVAQLVMTEFKAPWVKVSVSQARAWKRT